MFQYFPRVEYYISVADEFNQLEKIKEEVNELMVDICENRNPSKIASEILDVMQACATRLYKMEDDGEIELQFSCDKHVAKMNVRIEMIDFNQTLGIIGDGRGK